MPNLVAYDICGVQPMTSLYRFDLCMKARYNDYPTEDRLDNSEALFGEARSGYSSAGTPTAGFPAGSDPVSDPFDASISPDTYASDTVAGMSTANAEALGDGSTSGYENFAEMSFTIEKATVTAKSRALKAEYTLELAQDLKAIHGLDAESELANILSSEILAEINREVVRNVNLKAKTELLTLLHQVHSTLTLMPTVDGLLRNSKVYCSKSKESLTRSHKKQEEVKVTLSFVQVT